MVLVLVCKSINRVLRPPCLGNCFAASESFDGKIRESYRRMIIEEQKYFECKDDTSVTLGHIV